VLVVALFLQDVDGSGKIRYTEFLAATIEAHGSISEERLAEAFDRIDADDSGYISAENLKAMLGDEFSERDIEEIIKEADLTHDGQISYAEFLALWEDQHEAQRELAINEISLLRPMDSERSRMSSELSFDGEPDIVPRANFIASKMLSERRAKEEDKKVSFQDTMEEVPVATYDTFDEGVAQA
jgi:EF-hand domain pair